MAGTICSLPSAEVVTIERTNHTALIGELAIRGSEICQCFGCGAGHKRSPRLVTFRATRLKVGQALYAISFRKSQLRPEHCVFRCSQPLNCRSSESRVPCRLCASHKRGSGRSGGKSRGKIFELTSYLDVRFRTPYLTCERCHHPGIPIKSMISEKFQTNPWHKTCSYTSKP